MTTINKENNAFVSPFHQSKPNTSLKLEWPKVLTPRNAYRKRIGYFTFLGNKFVFISFISLLKSELKNKATGSTFPHC